MTRRRPCGNGSRIAGCCLAWLLLVGAPWSRVASQQDVSEVEDDDIVLPTVVLELDEPAAGGLEVALPVDIQVVAPERWPPLPEAGDLDIDLRTAVAAPAMEFALAGDEGPAHTLVAETYVSVGTTISTDKDAPAGLPLAQLDSGLSVLGTGPGGDFSLVFTHSLRDGIRNHRRPGESAKTQRHELAGSVGLGLGSGQFDAEASMVNSEHGFGFLPRGWENRIDESERRNAAESQAVAGAASYRIQLGDLIQLTPSLDLLADATTLTGRNPETHSELWAAPELALNWSTAPIDLQFSARYLLRRYAELGRTTEELLRHKVNAGVAGRMDLGAQTGLELSLGWSWRSDEGADFDGHRFVPQAVISGTPASWFTYRLAGGFEVRELGVGSVTERYSYVEPDRVMDDDGWFAFGRAQFGLGELAGLSELTIVATTRLATHSAALWPSKEPNDRDLYDLSQRSVELSFIPGLGLGLGFGDTLQIRANVSGEVLREHVSLFAPLLQSELEVEARTSDGGLGVRLHATMDHVPKLPLQVPEVELEGLWRQGATTVTLSLTDILELADGPREDWPPYYRPGFGAAVSVQLAL